MSIRTLLDDDQGVRAPEQHGAGVYEVGGQDAAGLDGQELFPDRASTAGRVDFGIVEDRQIPLSCDEATLPGEQGRRGHEEHLVPLWRRIRQDSAASHSRSAG